MAAAKTFDSSVGSTLKRAMATKIGQTVQRPDLAFTPWAQPTAPPPGSYDPALDAQKRASDRGLQYLQDDTALNNARGLEDYQTSSGRLQLALQQRLGDISLGNTRATEDYNTGTTRLAQDANTGYQRNDQDFATANQGLDTSLGRLNEDYGTNTAALQRSFKQLGQAQTGAAAAQGVSGGGTLAAALRARQANQGIQQQGLDTAVRRGQEDIGTARTALGVSHDRASEDIGRSTSRASDDMGMSYNRYIQDQGTTAQRLNEGYSNDVFDLNRSFQRSRTDSAVPLQRAITENSEYGRDIGDQRWAQATQAGYTVPGRGEPGGPASNEFQDANGNAYKLIIRGNRRFRVAPDGTETFVGTRPTGR